jgi:lipopolysaccharide export system permease protein
MQMLPPSALLAVIILFSLMKKRNEIVALKCAGMNQWQVSKPIILTALLLSIFLFFFSELVVPVTSSKSERIYRIEVDKVDPHDFSWSNVWFKGAKCIYRIRRYDSKNKIMKNLSLYFLDSSFRLRKRIDARRGIWKGGQWEIRDGIILTAEEGDDYSLEKFDRIVLDLPETPEMFTREEKKPEEMGYWQLKRFAEDLSREGYDATPYFVDLHIKLSFPFIVLSMVLIGIPIGLRKIKGGTPMTVTMGVLFCFLYLLALGFSRSLALAGVFPPLLAAWLANILFFFLGVYFMLHEH